MRVRLVIAALVVVFAAAWATAGSDQKVPDSEAARLAYRLDRILDKLPEPKIPVTEGLLKAWTYEILPYFEYEGVIGHAVPPESVSLVPYLEAMEHHHVLGRAYCTEAGGGPVEINA